MKTLNSDGSITDAVGLPGGNSVSSQEAAFAQTEHRAWARTKEPPEVAITRQREELRKPTQPRSVPDPGESKTADDPDGLLHWNKLLAEYKEMQRGELRAEQENPDADPTGE